MTGVQTCALPICNNADGREESPAVTAPQRSSPPVFVTPPATRGPSPLAELNTITIIKHHKGLDKIHITSFFGALSNALHVFSQVDEMRCTLLLDVNGDLKDMAKCKIVRPLNRIFHGRPMADDVFRVELIRPLPGCAGLYLGGQKADLPDKYQCTKHLFCSQDMPEAAPEQVGLSQDPVQEAIKDVMAPKEPKKTG